MDHSLTLSGPETGAALPRIGRFTDPRNITFDLMKHADRTPDAPALLTLERQISYRELDHLTWKFAQYLFANGVRQGDVIAITFADELALVLTMLAITRLGAVVFSIPRAATPFQRRDMAASAKVKILATDQPVLFDAGIPVVPVDCQAICDADIRIDRDILCALPTAPWLLITSSGSTGKQKRMKLMHAAARARFEIGSSSLQFTAADRIAPFGDFDFASAKSYLFSALWCGASSSLSAWSTPDPILHCLRQSVTVVYATVFHAEKMLEKLPADATNAFGGIRAFVLAASPVSDDLRRRIKKLLTPNLYVRYGINETGLLTIAGPPEVFEISGTIGKQLAGVDIEIVDAVMQPLGPNSIGLIRVKSPGLVSGYQDDEIAAKHSFRDGWLHPDDLGERNDDGQIIFRGRADHMMILNGINIYPAEIEQILTGHPAVRLAAAMPIAHKIHQDIPVCAVVLHPGAVVSEQNLLHYARERLGARGPHLIAILDEIPCDAQGKLNRQILRDRILARTDRTKNVQPHQATPRRQLALYLNVAFSVPAQASLRCLDSWLEILGIQLSPLPEAGEHKAAQWLWRVALLARQWLQIGRVPVFDLPSIVSLAPDCEVPEKWNAKLTFSLVEHVPHPVYFEVLNRAFRLSEWAASNAVDDENRNRFFAVIEKLARDRLANLAANGKSTIPLLRIAYQKGIPFIHLGGGLFQLGWGKNAQLFDRSTTRLDSAMGSKLSQNKVLTAMLLREGGLPAPAHEVAANADDAIMAAQRLGWPVVVKPADLDRGEGVTMDVADESDLRPAFEAAARLTPARRVLIERQVAGVCHRLFIADGALLYAVARLPMSVRGNGTHTVAELVAHEVAAQQQRPPWKRSEILPLDDLAERAMQRAGVSKSSIPEDGVLVPLRRIESTEWGGVDEDVTKTIHPENIRAALRATELLGLNVAGVDLISPDISKPWYENGAIINEVNFAPLLGGAEISRRHIQLFLERFVRGDGRIPVEVFVGGDAAWHAASQRWRILAGGGMQAYLTNASQTLAPSGDVWVMPFTSLTERVRALVRSAQVGCIVLVVQTDELLYSGLPIPSVDAVTKVDTNLAPHREASNCQNEAMGILLDGWISPSSTDFGEFYTNGHIE